MMAKADERQKANNEIPETAANKANKAQTTRYRPKKGKYCGNDTMHRMDSVLYVRRIAIDLQADDLYSAQFVCVCGGLMAGTLDNNCIAPLSCPASTTLYTRLVAI
jgi:hypothetical protein